MASQPPSLDIADPVLLIEFMHTLVEERGTVVLAAGARRASELDDVFFMVDGGHVSGPYLDLDDLLERTGQEVFRMEWSLQETGPEGAGHRVVYSWGGQYLTLDSERGVPSVFADQEAAMLMDEDALWLTEGFYRITVSEPSESLTWRLLREHPDSPMRPQGYLSLNGVRVPPEEIRERSGGMGPR